MSFWTVAGLLIGGAWLVVMALIVALARAAGEGNAMAAISVPAPGAKNGRGVEIGPCVEICTHMDCADLRELAGLACTRCQKPIGYDRLYYNGPVHADCEER